MLAGVNQDALKIGFIVKGGHERRNFHEIRPGTGHHSQFDSGFRGHLFVTSTIGVLTGRLKGLARSDNSLVNMTEQPIS
jgi:hypothetical protein